MSQNTSSNSGVGGLTLLNLLFIGLKLTDHITWSWWWVMSPVWIPIVLIVVAIIITGLILGIASARK